MQLRLYEVAERLGLSMSTVRRYVATGVLPKTQYLPGGIVFVNAEAVEELRRGGAKR